jgi:hypothetical protein
MKHSSAPILLSILGLSLPAFAQTGAGTPGISTPSAQSAPIPLKLVLPTTDQSGMLLVSTARPRPGQPVALSFVVSNKTNKPVVYNFPTGQKFDITASDAKGTLVWTWSKGQQFTQNISRLSIPPNGRQVFAAVWNGRTDAGRPVPPGDYTLNARMTSNTGTAITGSIVVNNDPDPMNVGRPTRTPADTGAIRQVDVTPPVTATKTITVGVPAPASTPK